MIRHGSDLKFCSCKACRSSRRNARGNWEVLHARRAGRRKAKQQLKQGIIPGTSSNVPYLG